MRMEPQGPRTLGSSHHCPTQTSAEIEAAVLEAKERTGYGRKRLAWYLWRKEGLALSSHTICHILYRNGFRGRKKKRKTFYPAYWAWGEERLFALAQVDVKDVLDNGTLGTKLWDNMVKRKPPLPVDVPGRANEAPVPGVEPRGYPDQRAVFHGSPDAVAPGVRDRRRGCLANGLGGVRRGQPHETAQAPSEALCSGGGEAFADPSGEEGTQRPGGAIPPDRRRGVLPAVPGKGADGRRVPEESCGVVVLTTT
jgi:hypothetical protein